MSDIEAALVEGSFGQLPASAYEVGDIVIGDNGDGTASFGHVVRAVEDGPGEVTEVTVRWRDEEYGVGTVGHLVKAEWLRLWPRHKQLTRLQQLATTER